MSAGECQPPNLPEYVDFKDEETGEVTIVPARVEDTDQRRSEWITYDLAFDLGASR